MPNIEIVRIPVLSDNYVWLMHEPAQQATAVIDPAVSEPVLAELAKRGWRLTHILNTHHHPDHVGGNLDIKERTGCTIVGNRADAQRIPGIDVTIGEGDTVRVGAAEAQVYEVSGHTVGHIAYHFPEAHALFCGDTIFSLGCGRMFEGDPDMYWRSLSKLRELPDDTRIYCAHEYTQANYRFAASIDPENLALLARGAEIVELRDRGEATVPSILADEKQANPFLRADAPELQARLGMERQPPADVFAEIRRRKDAF